CTNCSGGIPDGTKVYVWDVTNQVFWPPATFSLSSGNWDTNFYLPPGRGFVVNSPSAWTNTFVGIVCTCYTNHTFVAGANKFSFLGSKVPINAPLSGTYPSGSYDHQFQGSDGDNVFLFMTTSQSYSDALDRKSTRLN